MQADSRECSKPPGQVGPHPYPKAAFASPAALKLPDLPFALRGSRAERHFSNSYRRKCSGFLMPEVT